jgi:hypothetical protein
MLNTAAPRVKRLAVESRAKGGNSGAGRGSANATTFSTTFSVADQSIAPNKMSSGILCHVKSFFRPSLMGYAVRTLFGLTFLFCGCSQLPKPYIRCAVVIVDKGLHRLPTNSEFRSMEAKVSKFLAERGLSLVRSILSADCVVTGVFEQERVPPYHREFVIDSISENTFRELSPPFGETPQPCFIAERLSFVAYDYQRARWL